MDIKSTSFYRNKKAVTLIEAIYFGSGANINKTKSKIRNKNINFTYCYKQIKKTNA